MRGFGPLDFPGMDVLSQEKAVRKYLMCKPSEVFRNLHITSIHPKQIVLKDGEIERVLTLSISHN